MSSSTPVLGENTFFEDFLTHMKVVIWKPDLGVVGNKKQDISATTKDIKNLKLKFCRGDLRPFDELKILVKKCWLKLWICWLKSKSGLKNDTISWSDSKAGGFLQYRV